MLRTTFAVLHQPWTTCSDTLTRSTEPDPAEPATHGCTVRGSRALLRPPLRNIRHHRPCNKATFLHGFLSTPPRR
ncbi:hypothetical protein GCM10010211_76340 [Streptomyces albospinus]|uniref:Secreted protein n=1 Tax=Streptomyces albospinus TaxID=285515 RepID=A0ABQ2VMU7_9ACTN|nr:hypothetical protein GCM10010211_76340 [Streptomyces albospinus]